jgi:uroporphyrinogen decarboxylase
VNDVVIRAARGERTPYTPIWLMRQAGRCDPEYNKIREECGLPLERLFRHPELAARISLLPKRFNVDAIIFFQDILTPLAPMGAEFVFRPGPVLVSPVRSANDLERLTTFDVDAELGFVAETLRLVRGSLRGELPVLGFAGAPLTLATFILEGGSFGTGAPFTLKALGREPAAVRRLLDKLADMTVDYLRLQIECGAAAVQLFESAANLFSVGQYREWALPYQRKIFDGIRGLVPTILFARSWSDLDSLRASGADVISLSGRIGIAEWRERFGVGQAVQGNLDNRLLASGTWEAVAAAAERCVREGGHCGHIFNLSHGLLRETPLEHVIQLVDHVRSLRNG